VSRRPTCDRTPFLGRAMTERRPSPPPPRGSPQRGHKPCRGSLREPLHLTHSERGHAKPQPTGACTPSAVRGGQEETGDVPASPQGGQVAARRGVFTFPAAASHWHLFRRSQCNIQVKPDGGNPAEPPANETSQPRTSKVEPAPLPGGASHGRPAHAALKRHCTKVS